MALSEHEQRLLDEMERSLYQHDADVVPTDSAAAIRISGRSVAFAVLALVIGLGIIIGAIVIDQAWAGIFGFVVMIGGAYWAFSTGRKAPEADSGIDSDRPSPSVGPRKSRSTQRRSMMDRLGDRWDRRQDGEQ